MYNDTIPNYDPHDSLNITGLIPYTKYIVALRQRSASKQGQTFWSNSTKAQFSTPESGNKLPDTGKQNLYFLHFFFFFDSSFGTPSASLGLWS